MIPQWAKQVGLNAKQLREWMIADGHHRHILDQLLWFAEHGSFFDVTFYDREPLLEVRIKYGFVSKFWAAIAEERPDRFEELINNIEFSDGTRVFAGDIWTLVWIPPHLDIRGADLGAGEQIIGFNGATARQIIRETYRCASRAEEDFFLARWIAS
jgi:hypothetical protein